MSFTGCSAFLSKRIFLIGAIAFASLFSVSILMSTICMMGSVCWLNDATSESITAGLPENLSIEYKRRQSYVYIFICIQRINKGIENFLIGVFYLFHIVHCFYPFTG